MAFLSSIFFTASCVVRGLESKEVLVSKGFLCLASFSTGMSFIISEKLKKDSEGKTKKLPWYQPNPDLGGELTFKLQILLVIMVRGVFEFIGSTLYIYTLKVALENDLNQGLCSVYLMLAGVMLTIMSWGFYNEKLSET